MLDRRFAYLFLSTSSLLACGGISRTDHPGLGSAGRSSGGGGASGDDSAAGRASGGSGVAGSTAAGAGGNDACTSFNDESPQLVSVLIRNDTGSPIYLGSLTESCAPTPLFVVRDASGMAIVQPSNCRLPCEAYMNDHTGAGCPAICAPPQTIRLLPGESLSTQWDGLNQVQRMLPHACDTQHISGEQSPSCDVTQRIEPGNYVFSALAGSAAKCQLDVSGAAGSTGDSACGGCLPNGGGGCTINGAIAGGTKLATEADVLLDGHYGIGPGGDGSGIGQVQSVELSFR